MEFWRKVSTSISPPVLAVTLTERTAMYPLVLFYYLISSPPPPSPL